MFDAHDVDSVAYGTAAADLGSAAAALPSPSDNRALRLGTISGPVNNSTDYSLQATSSVAKSVAGGSLTTDLDTPRNNLRQVATLGSSTDTDNDGVLNANDLCPGTPPSTVVDSTGCSDAQVDADLDLVCDPTAPMGHGGGGPPPFCTGSDNCPTTANPTQANVVHPGTPAGDACDDPDLDGVFDASDNCPGNTNSNQANFDGDSQGDACDSEDDGDGYSDEAEAGSPVCMFAVNDDDADDTRINDGCPAVGPAESDCADTVEPLDDDGDGRVNDGCAQVATISEGAFNIGTGTLAACAAGAGPDPSTGWPSDFVSGQVPDSTDKVTISDLSSYVVPARLLDTSPGDTEFAARWDIVPGRGEFGVFADWIAIDDLTALIVGSTGMPPMLGGARALDGPACTGT